VNRIDDHAAAVSPRRGRILIAEDEPMNRSLFQRLLKSVGHEVLLAKDGQQALEMACADQPDVILLDVMMPKLNGIEVCRRLKADPLTAPIPILMITGSDERAMRIKGVAAGADDFLTKPIDHEELVLRVRNAVFRKQLFDELAKKYAELKTMAELRDSLTRMLDADTEVLASQIQPQAQDAVGRPGSAQGGDHGAH
jgi:CheY-like chemotaxis protein